MITAEERHPLTFQPTPGDTPTWYRCPLCGSRLWMGDRQYVGGQGEVRWMMCPTCEYIKKATWREFDMGKVVEMGNALDRAQQWKALEMMDEGWELEGAINALIEMEAFREDAKEIANMARGE